jgi:hypothetical protein
VWYAYVVFNELGPDSWLLEHSRSLDFGATWTMPLPDLLDYYCQTSDARDFHPDLDFGSHNLFVVYTNASFPCSENLQEIFVIRSTDFGDTFESPVQLTSNSVKDFLPAVAAVKSETIDKTVVVAYTHDYLGLDLDVWYDYSHDGGLTWTPFDCLSCFVAVDELAPDLQTSFSQGLIHAAFTFHLDIVYRSTDHIPLSWTNMYRVNYGDWAGQPYPRPSVVVNPTRPPAEEAGITWTDSRYVHYNIYYDGPGAVGLGDVIVDVDPDALNAPWTLNGPDGYQLNGNGDLTVTDVSDGNWMITWADFHPDWSPPSPNPEYQNLVEGGSITFYGEYGYKPPRFVSITDVANDQGRNVRLVWERSCFDIPDDGVNLTGYGIYRRQDAYKATHDSSDPREALEPGRADAKLEGWDSVGWISAHGDDIYQYVAATLCDSTADNGICWSVFFVRATTDDPFTYFDSDPDSGYSIDNLAPAVPTGITVTYSADENKLDWDPCPDHDFQYFRVYRGTDPDFVPDTNNLVHTTTDVSWFDSNPGGWQHHYKLSAVDFAGNESEPGSPEAMTGTAPDRPVQRFALHPSSPNPFNPRTTIVYELPYPVAVTLEVFDLRGRLLRVLRQDAREEAGRHEVIWDGCDQQGSSLASGTYLYRLRAGTYVETRRMVLLK